METKFYKCKHCGQIVEVIKLTGAPLVCCGDKMEELIPGTTDASLEKHVPVMTRNGNVIEVKVGSVEHPMIKEHYIEWVVLQTKKGNQRKQLHPEEKPCVRFVLEDDDEVEAVYAYCNLHGLWRA